MGIEEEGRVTTNENRDENVELDYGHQSKRKENEQEHQGNGRSGWDRGEGERGKVEVVWTCEMERGRGTIKESNGIECTWEKEKGKTSQKMDGLCKRRHETPWNEGGMGPRSVDVEEGCSLGWRRPQLNGKSLRRRRI